MAYFGAVVGAIGGLVAYLERGGDLWETGQLVLYVAITIGVRPASQQNLTMNEAQFAPFPGNPVIPGILVIEGIAQTACVLALRLMPPTERRRSMFFLTIDKAKFRKPVRPGDTLEYHVDKVAKRRNIWWYRGEAKVGGVLVAEAELGACLAEK
jgi:3-hydroxyacyl-[acyl-carrier-protein] dehydratase